MAQIELSNETFEVFIGLVELTQALLNENIGAYNSAAVLNSTALNAETDKLLEIYERNLYIDGPLLYVLIFLYGILITFGTVGNCLTVAAVIRKQSMRTPRNMFIINLAVSDLLLCVVTMPLTLMEIVTAYWPLGSIEFVCKTVNSLQAISIFVSTISITAIALDRYHVIVYPTKPSVQRVGAVFALIGIWSLACVLAAPLIHYSKLKHIPMNYTELPSIDFCYEDWPLVHGRAYYSVFSIIIQYALPITVVSVAYCRICKKLRYRMKPGGGGGRAALENSSAGPGTSAPGKIGGSVRKDQGRVRRTNVLLISIALIFGISWMPMNVFNLVVDLVDPFRGERYWEKVAFAFCHLFGMSSANTNPLLYGFFNDNFRKEFKDIWLSLKRFYCCCCSMGAGSGSGSSSRLGAHREDLSGRSQRCGGPESRMDREPTVTYRKSKASSPPSMGGKGEIAPSAPTSVSIQQPLPPIVDDFDCAEEQSSLISHVLDRQK